MGISTSRSVFYFHFVRLSIAPRVERVRTRAQFCASSPAVQPRDSALTRRRSPARGDESGGLGW
jgi:hypothetical protein